MVGRGGSESDSKERGCVNITAINKFRRLVITKEYGVCHIESMLDSDGDYTDDPNEAVAVVFQLSDGGWSFAICSDFDKVELN